LAGTETLTGKTLTGNTAVTLVSGAATVTLPTTTSTLSTLALTEALTNKSYNGNTITSGTGTLTLAASSSLVTSGANSITLTSTAATNVTLPTTGTLSTLTGVNSQKECFILACSDETTNLTTGVGKVEFQMPYAFTVTEVFATVTTVATGATLLTVDINEAGTSIISTKITLDASEKTSRTAATAPVISDSSLANSAVMTIDIDAVGNTTAGKGLKVYIVGYQT